LSLLGCRPSFRGLSRTLGVLPRYSLSVGPCINTSSICIAYSNTLLDKLRWKKGLEFLSPMATRFNSNSRDESRVLLWIRMQRCLMILCREINNAKDLVIQSPHSIDNLLVVGIPLVHRWLSSIEQSRGWSTTFKVDPQE
jgi:hypothetical protein